MELELNAAILDTFLTGNPMGALFIRPLIIPKYASVDSRYPEMWKKHKSCRKSCRKVAEKLPKKVPKNCRKSCLYQIMCNFFDKTDVVFTI